MCISAQCVVLFELTGCVGTEPAWYVGGFDRSSPAVVRGVLLGINGEGGLGFVGVGVLLQVMARLGSRLGDGSWFLQCVW